MLPENEGNAARETNYPKFFFFFFSQGLVITSDRRSLKKKKGEMNRQLITPNSMVTPVLRKYSLVPRCRFVQVALLLLLRKSESCVQSADIALNQNKRMRFLTHLSVFKKNCMNSICTTFLTARRSQLLLAVLGVANVRKDTLLLYRFVTGTSLNLII